MSSSIVSPFPFFTDTTGAPLEGGYIYLGQSNLNPETAPVNVFWDAALTIPAGQPIRTVGGYPSRAGTASRLYVATDTYSITVRNKNRALVFSAFDQSDAPTSVFDISTQLITAGVNQLTFALTAFTYLPGTDTLEVYRNGLRLNLNLDYLETNSSTVTLTAPATAGDQFLFQGGAVITGGNISGSGVSFIQAGTGAVARNIQDKARESVSVLDFGADLTGGTDTISQFQAAVDSLPATGGNIAVPNGTYRLNSAPSIGTKSINWLISPGAVFNGTSPWPNFFANTTCRTNGIWEVQKKAHNVIDGAATFAHAIESIQPATDSRGYGALFLGAALNAPGTYSINTGLNSAVVANVGSSGNIWGIEINVENYTSPSAGTQLGLAVTSGGGGDITFGIKLDRISTGATSGKFLFGLAIRHSRIGIYVESTPELENAAVFGTVPVRYGGSTIQALQINNSGSVLLLQRLTNTSPSGYFVNAINADNTAQLFSVDTLGNVSGKSYAMTGAAQAVGAGNTSIGNGTTTSASAGAAALPANPRGFIKGYAEGVEIRIPYYNA